MEKKRKILLIHHSGLLGGAGISLFFTWRILSKHYDVVCYIPDDPPALAQFLESKGFHFKTFSFMLAKLTYYSGGNSIYGPRFWYHTLRIPQQITYWKKIIEEENPNLIIVNSKVLAWMAPLFKGRKSLIFVRETIPDSNLSIMDTLMRKLLDHFSGVSFLSQYDADRECLSNAHSFVIHDFLRIETYESILSKEEACSKLRIKNAPFNLLFVGGINKLKGLDIALDAVKMIQDKDIQLIIAGTDTSQVTTKGIKGIISKIARLPSAKWSKSLKALTDDILISDRIVFLGKREEMSSLYAACDAVLIPMKKPHQARPIYEIGVQSKTAIVSDFPNIQEFLSDGENGRVFRPNDPIDLARVIIELKNDKEKRKELGKNNNLLTHRFHSYNYAEKEITTMIRNLLR